MFAYYALLFLHSLNNTFYASLLTQCKKKHIYFFLNIKLVLKWPFNYIPKRTQKTTIKFFFAGNNALGSLQLLDVLICYPKMPKKYGRMP